MKSVEQYKVFSVELEGTAEGNPYVDVTFGARFERADGGAPAVFAAELVAQNDMGVIAAAVCKVGYAHSLVLPPRFRSMVMRVPCSVALHVCGRGATRC